MTAQDRINGALGRLATATNVIRTRSQDAERSKRNGSERDEGIVRAAEHLEAAADELCKALAK